MESVALKDSIRKFNINKFVFKSVSINGKVVLIHLGLQNNRTFLLVRFRNSKSLHVISATCRNKVASIRVLLKETKEKGTKKSTLLKSITYLIFVKKEKM